MRRRWWRKIDAADVMMVLGLGLMTAGLWLFEPIVALVVIGAILWKMGLTAQKKQG